MEALAKFKASPERYDLAIIDQVMPGMSGSQLSIELTMCKPGMPVILCTGFSDSLSHEELTELGIGDILKKPILMKDLAVMVRRILDGVPASA